MIPAVGRDPVDPWCSLVSQTSLLGKLQASELYCLKKERWIQSKEDTEVIPHTCSHTSTYMHTHTHMSTHIHPYKQAHTCTLLTQKLRKDFSSYFLAALGIKSRVLCVLDKHTELCLWPTFSLFINRPGLIFRCATEGHKHSSQ